MFFLLCRLSRMRAVPLDLFRSDTHTQQPQWNFQLDQRFTAAAT
jgi:hypothetical protein